MNNAFLVRCIEGIGNLDGDADQIICGEWAVGNPVTQCPALEQFHGDEVKPVGFIHFVDCADIRVVQSGRSPGLAQQPLHHLRVTGDFGWQAFERHLAAQTRVFRPVYHAHAARAQGVKQLVMGDCRAEH